MRDPLLYHIKRELLSASGLAMGDMGFGMDVGMGEDEGLRAPPDSLVAGEPGRGTGSSAGRRIFDKKMRKERGTFSGEGR